MTHTMIVTKLPDDQDDDVVYTIEGPHDGNCQVWYTCPTSSPCQSEAGPYSRPDDDPISDETEWTFHDVDHRWIDSEWMTLSKDCAADTDGAQGDLDDIARKRGIGSWPVEIDYWGDGTWQAIDLTKNEES